MVGTVQDVERPSLDESQSGLAPAGIEVDEVRDRLDIRESLELCRRAAGIEAP